MERDFESDCGLCVILCEYCHFPSLCLSERDVTVKLDEEYIFVKLSAGLHQNQNDVLFVNVRSFSRKNIYFAFGLKCEMSE